MPSTEPLWTATNLHSPHTVADKAARVRAMFTAIAPSYDLNNRVHSLGLDQAWRRAAVREAGLTAGDVVLDVACGTGDLSMAFAHAGAQRVIGVDFTPGMLELAQQKAQTDRGAAPGYLAGDAMRLPLADASADVVTIAFGIRNVADQAAAVAEFYRVLRPGGRLVILEFGMPSNRLCRALYNLYFTQVLPRTASLVARDRTGAYRYLPKSVQAFINREQMVGMMEESGFAEVRARALTFGVAVLYRGVKRA